METEQNLCINTCSSASRMNADRLVSRARAVLDQQLDRVCCRCHSTGRTLSPGSMRARATRRSEFPGSH